MNSFKYGLVFLFSSLLFMPVHAGERFISVSGEGQIEVMPDYLNLRLLVSAEASDSKAAKQLVDQAMNTVLNISQALEIANEDIDASQLSNQPVYDWNNGKSSKRAEQVSRIVKITLRDLNSYTHLLHQLVAIDHVQIQHSSLHFNDPAALDLQASELALKQAKHKAAAMAAVLNTRLGKVLSIEEHGNAPRALLGMRANAMADSAAPAPMLVQKQTITSAVQVRFELK